LKDQTYMSIYNKVAGNYYLVTVEPDSGNVSSDNVTIQTHTVKIDGNLTVTGETTTINVEETTIEDPYIVLGNNNTGDFPEVGIIAQTGTDELAGLRFNSGTNQWEVSDSVDLNGTGTYTPIATATAAAPGGDVNAIQFKSSTTSFGGADYFVVDVANSAISLDGSQTLIRQPSVPAAVTNATVVYADTPDLGDSGIYVNNNTETDEIIAYKRARKLALIL